MKIITGLGNPGKKYENTRHNVGFVVVDMLAQAFNAPSWQEKFNGLYTTVSINGQKVGLLKPTTYMNLSGKAVQAAMVKLKFKPEDLIVVHDELDLPASKVRIKTGGGDAGHNGLRSITAAIGNNYTRVRIGIGHPGEKSLVSAYVLGKNTEEDTTLLHKLAVEEIPALLEDK